ncbi:MAG: peptidase MA family metallohydrolase [Ktedonobacteraceae bacterium]|nr:peptidase MA family metallohydrolase [Chloroflexota bacterium]
MKISLRRIRSVCLLIAVCFCTSFLSFTVLNQPASASATSDPITITSQTATVSFPKRIDFQMSASDSSAAITQATLFIMFENGGYQQRTVTITSGRTVAAHWLEGTGGDNFHNPGTAVSYYWDLQDSAQHVHTDQPHHFTLIDTRFTWRHLAQGLLQVNWYNHPTSFGQVLLSKANSSLTHISQILGSGLKRSITLWIYASPADFQGSLPPGSYEWVGGIAFPQDNTAFISVESTDDVTLVRDMPHEMTHLLFHQITSQGIFAPRWFDEGLAVYNQIFHEPDMGFRFQRALNGQALLLLDNIAQEFPANADQAYLAYAESWKLLDYMYTTFGRAKMNRLISAINNPQTDFNQDMQQTLGEDQHHLENQWHIALHQPPTLTPQEMVTPTAQPALQVQPRMPAVTDNTTPIFTVLGIVLILGALGGIVIIFSVSSRRRQKEWAVEAASQIIASSMADPARGQPGSQAPYTHPAAYMPPSQWSGPPPPAPGQPRLPAYFNAGNPPPNSWAAPPSTPPVGPYAPGSQGAQPDQGWLAPPQNGSDGRPVLPPFSPGQEYMGNRENQPGRQAPQD